MLRSLFSEDGIRHLILLVPVILVSISFHEYAHAWMADRLGDPSARYLGRLTLNPLKHFNIFGFLMMILVGFGWATPVPVNPNNFKNPSRGMLATALAGPIANLTLAIASSLIYALLYQIIVLVGISSDFQVELLGNVFTLLLYLIYMNIGLAVFNLIPVYPLDGSRVLGYFLPTQYHDFMLKYGQYVQIGFVLIVLLTDVVGDIVGVVQSGVANLLISFWELVLGVFF